MRNNSAIILYRPSTDNIVWSKTGPWKFQHDVDFISDHQISVFGNVSFRMFNNNDIPDDKQSYVFFYDFMTNNVSVPYHNAMESMRVYTASEGLSEVLPNGDIFIEEQNRGRLLRLTPDAVKWEFVRRVDENNLSMPSWSRYLTEDQVRDILPILEQSKSDQ